MSGEAQPVRDGEQLDWPRVSRAMIETLADLHAIDIEVNGLAHLGKPAGFVDRQVRGWTERWYRSKTDEIPEMEALSAWLPANLPPSAVPPAIVHGDFKLDNVMLDPADVGRLAAIFDWEMTALGDPLIDVGIFLAYWSQGRGLEPNDAYAAKSGRDLSRPPPRATSCGGNPFLSAVALRAKAEGLPTPGST